MNSEELLNFLKATKIFAHVPDEVLAIIQDNMEQVQLAAGSILFKEGEPGDVFYLIVEGEVGIYSDSIEIATRVSGDCIGELAVLDDAPRSATGAAKTDVVLLKCHRDDLQQMVTTSREVVTAVFSALALTIREAVGRQTALGRLQAEMAEARKIQENLIPDTVPEIPGYEVYGLYHPRGGVGGDYYDYIQHPDGSWGLAIFDVSGKGMQAALLMATLRAGLRSEISRQSDLLNMVLTLNSLLYTSSTEDKFATFFYAQLQPDENVLTSVSADHDYPLVVRDDGSSEWLGMNKSYAALGMFPDDMFLTLSDSGAETTYLSSGDVVLFYTDGVTETTNANDEEYGEERLQDAVTRVRQASAKDTCTAIYNSVMEFQGEAPQFDDLTLMVLKRK